ncbi:MAG TPA: hypothetical protein VGR71_16865 [Nitrospira sp.]|nr:hypothetical protein [Nitrospira sp.]
MQDDIDRYTAAAVDLRELLRQTHEAISDLRRERAGLKRDRAEFVDSKDLIARLDKATGDGIKQFIDQMTAHIRETEETVTRRFDTILMICLGEEPSSVRKGERTVIELIREFVRSKKLAIKITEEVHLEMSHETAADQKQDEAVINTIKLFKPDGFDGLPIVYDSRIPRGTAYLVLPPANESDRRKVYEMNISSGAGCAEAHHGIIEFARRKYVAEKRRLDEVPAAFRRKPKPAGEAEPA